MARRKIYKIVGQLVESLRGWLIDHTGISFRQAALYTVHLSVRGMDIWLHGICNWLFCLLQE